MTMPGDRATRLSYTLLLTDGRRGTLGVGPKGLVPTDLGGPEPTQMWGHNQQSWLLRMDGSFTGERRTAIRRVLGLTSTVGMPIDTGIGFHRPPPGGPAAPMSTERASTSETAASRHVAMAEAFELFAQSMGPFIDARMSEYFADDPSWQVAAANRMGRGHEHGATDPLFQLLVLRRFWTPVFAEYFGQDLRPILQKLVEARNLWAHLNLPDDVAYLDQTLLGLERVLAPVEAEPVGRLRRIRTRLKNPMPTRAEDDLDASTSSTLRSQIHDSETAFIELQQQLAAIQKQLDISRKASAGKQLRLAELERELIMRDDTASELMENLEQERSYRNRVEWLFVGFIVITLTLSLLTSQIVGG